MLKLLGAIAGLITAIGAIAVPIAKILREEFRETRAHHERINDTTANAFSKQVDRLMESHTRDRESFDRAVQAFESRTNIDRVRQGG